MNTESASIERRPRYRQSPLVRRLARESGLDLDRLAGSGAAGRVTRADVARAAQAQAAPDEVDRPRTQHVAVPFTTVIEVDLSRLVAVRDRPAAGTDDRLTLTAFVVDAVVQALRTYPRLNVSIDADGVGVEQHPSQRIGIAIDTANGHIASVIEDAGDLNLRGLSRRIAELGDRAGETESVGTVTVSEAGSRGALFDTPILGPGQAGALSTGAVVERPVVMRGPDGSRVIAIRSMAYVALTCDRRLIDEIAAGRFLAFVKERLEAERSDIDLS